MKGERKEDRENKRKIKQKITLLLGLSVSGAKMFRNNSLPYLNNTHPKPHGNKTIKGDDTYARCKQSSLKFEEELEPSSDAIISTLERIKQGC